MSRINFWEKEDGSMFNHSKGLDARDVEFLKTLKEGDRLMLKPTPKSKDTSPDFALGVYIKKQDRPVEPTSNVTDEFKPVKT